MYLSCNSVQIILSFAQYFSFIFVKFLIFIYLYMCVYVHMSAGTSRGHRSHILWSWNYKQLWVTWYGCWDLTLGLLEEQYMLLTTEPSSLAFFTATHHFSSGIQCWSLERFRVWGSLDFRDEVLAYVHVAMCVFLRKPNSLEVILISVYVSIVYSYILP